MVVGGERGSEFSCVFLLDERVKVTEWEVEAGGGGGNVKGRVAEGEREERSTGEDSKTLCH